MEMFSDVLLACFDLKKGEESRYSRLRLRSEKETKITYMELEVREKHFSGEETSREINCGKWYRHYKIKTLEVKILFKKIQTTE